MPSNEKIYRELETILELDANTILGTEDLDSLGWNSMALVMFIAMADEKYAVAIPPSKLVEAKTVDEVCKLTEREK